MTKAAGALLLIGIVSATAPAGTPKIPNAYYRITPPDGGEESYLLGTVHGSIGLDEFGADVDRQIARSKSVSVERVMAPPDLDAYAKDPITSLAKMAVFRGTPVDEGTRRKLVEYGIPASVAARLSDDQCGVLGAVGQARGLPLDLSVMQTAYRAKVEVKALDSDEMRTRAAAQQATERGSCSLKQIFSQYPVKDLRDHFLAEADSTLDDYRAGKLDDDDEINSPLVVSRNLAWMPSVLADVKRGGAFIAAGQDHLFGLNGLISLLRRRGYKVEEVTSAAQGATDFSGTVRPISTGSAR